MGIGLADIANAGREALHSLMTRANTSVSMGSKRVSAWRVICWTAASIGNACGVGWSVIK